MVVPHTGRLPSIEGAAAAERAFLAMCLAHGESGRRYLESLEDDHFSSQPLRRVRAHLLEHFGDPLAGLPDDDEPIAALITDVAFRAEDTPTSDITLRIAYVQLEMQRTNRRLQHAQQTADEAEQRALAPHRAKLRQELDELMGQAQ